MLDENEKKELDPSEKVIETSSKAIKKEKGEQLANINDTNEAVDEIEKSVAEDAENDESKEDDSIKFFFSIPL